MSLKSKQIALRQMLRGNIAIIVILIGVALVSLSIGPFQNPDTVWEFKAANGVIQWGMPFVEVQGSRINQPPLGFYAEGLFLSVFGMSIETGAVLIGLFGLGCTLLVCLLGKLLYGKQTGILAAAFFALTPWQLVMSNTFLIDAQCLFLSLSSLYVGILSIQKDSNRLILCSAVLFALAFYTKLFAVFVLIPLFLYYLQSQNRKLSRLPLKLAVFVLPLVLATLIWYTVDFYLMPSYLPKGLGYMFNHPDFADYNPVGVAASYSFVGVFLLDYGLGYFFVAATIFSIIAGLVLRKHIDKQMVAADWVFLVSILFIVGSTMYLGVTVNLKVPYTSTIKYVYQALPLFSFVAASLVPKCISIINLARSSYRIKKAAFFAVGSLGLALIALSVLSNTYSAHQLSTAGFIIFRVQPGQLLGYSFDNFNVIAQNSPLMMIQYLGFALVLSAVAYSSVRLILAKSKPV